MSVVTGIFALSNFKAYAKTNGHDGYDFQVILSIAATGCSLCFIWSWATDFLQYKIVYSFLLFLQITSNFSIPFVATEKILYAIEIHIMTLCLGGHFTLLPNVLKKIYGEQATELYGYMFSYYGLSYIGLYFV